MSVHIIHGCIENRKIMYNVEREGVGEKEKKEESGGGGARERERERERERAPRFAGSSVISCLVLTVCQTVKNCS